MTDEITVPFSTGPFEWWTDAAGNPWVRHECWPDGERLHLPVWRLPPPWRIEGDSIAPSLDCKRCGSHETIGPAQHVVPAWNWLISVDVLCTRCDGKDAPEPGCDWCDGTGIDKELAARRPGTGFTEVTLP